MTNIKAVSVSEIESILNKYEVTSSFDYGICQSIRALLDRSPDVGGEALEKAICILQDKIGTTSATPISDAIDEIRALIQPKKEVE